MAIEAVSAAAAEIGGILRQMQGVGECAGRQLGSVAHRYRSRTVRPCWPPPMTVGKPVRCVQPAARSEDLPCGEGPTARSARLARLEAALFLAQGPLGSRKLAQLACLADGTEARTLVRTLRRLYDAESCAFGVVEVAGGFQLVSRSKFASWLRRLHSSEMEVRLSGLAMETLAVVAYRQPVLRAAIEAIRGVQCGEILRQLMERDLVRIAGRSEELGRPFLYGTTRWFLQVFGLRHLDDLPPAPLLHAREPAAQHGKTSTGDQDNPNGPDAQQAAHSNQA